jgi:hypothetical protein
MGKYLDILRRVETQRDQYDQNDINDQSRPLTGYGKHFGRLGRLCRSSAPYEAAMDALERQCPERIEPDWWQQAVEDGRRFLDRWGEQAAALGWMTPDLFGLAPMPEKPAPNYRRLSRYDQTGLIWLLQGRPVAVLTDATASIKNPSGAVTIYRRHNKPALGPVGDSLDDFDL